MLAHACTRQLKDRPELRAQSSPLLRRDLKLLTSSNLSHGAPHPQPGPPLQRAGSHTQSPNLPTSMNAVWPSAPQAPRKAMWSAGFPSITLEEDQGAEACRTRAAPRQEAAVDRVQGRGKPGKPGPAHPRSLDRHRLDFGPAFLNVFPSSDAPDAAPLTPPGQDLKAPTCRSQETAGRGEPHRGAGPGHLVQGELGAQAAGQVGCEQLFRWKETEGSLPETDRQRPRGSAGPGKPYEAEGRAAVSAGWLGPYTDNRLFLPGQVPSCGATSQGWARTESAQ